MAGYDYNYRSGYSTDNPVGPYTTTGYSNNSLPPNVEPMRNSNYGYAVDGFPPRVYTEFNCWKASCREEGFNPKPHYDKYNRKPDAGLLGPIINTASQDGNKHKTSRSTRGSSGLPVRGDGRLSIPTDDMERALHYLRESTKSRK